MREKRCLLRRHDNGVDLAFLAFNEGEGAIDSVPTHSIMCHDDSTTGTNLLSQRATAQLS